MPIVRIPYGNALLTNQTDYARINNLLETGFLQVNKSIWEDAANNIVQGAVFQIGGTVYYANAATAIGGGASAYIKLTPSGDGSIVTPTYVANLIGITWNSAYNGYYDVGGNAYVFDEILAYMAAEINTFNTKLWQAIYLATSIRKGLLEIALTHYTDTTVPAIAAGGTVDINGALYKNPVEVAIGGATANSTWYDILLTPSNRTFTASFIARETGAWSDSKQGLYSGNNRVVACVWRNASAEFINKNILVVNNRTCKVKVEIGSWNMDSTASVAIDVGVTNTRIRDITVLIRINDDSIIIEINYPLNSGLGYDSTKIGYFSIRPTGINIARRDSSYFDSAVFNDPNINRGWIPIEYEV